MFPWVLNVPLVYAKLLFNIKILNNFQAEVPVSKRPQRGPARLRSGTTSS